MGSCCCGGSKGSGGDSAETPLLSNQNGYTELASIKQSKDVTRIIKTLNKVLVVILADAKRLFPDLPEAENFQQLVLVLDKVLQNQQKFRSVRERFELINRATPVEYPNFRKILYDQLLVAEADEKEHQNGRRRSATAYQSVASETRCELPRLLQLWFDADQDCSGSLSEAEVKRVLEQLNITQTSASLKAMFRAVDSSNDGQLQFFEFLTLYEMLTTTEDLKVLFSQFSVPSPLSKKGDRVMTPELLRKFLLEYQLETPEAAEQTMRRKSLEPREHDGIYGLTFRQFQSAMLDHSVNGWMNPKELKVNQDMTQPYTHYYIDCSHNTYLTGHQLTGESSTEMYRRALLNGCRCVELDCWDGPTGDPQVTHGHTITTKIRFYDVCLAINETAFVNSVYPVMLSLEIHTSIPQQQTMVRMMKEIFGNKLADAAMAERSTMFGFDYTPEALKYKILVKAKRLKGAAKSSFQDPHDDDDDASQPFSPAGSPGPAQPQEIPKKDTHAEVSQELSDLTYSASYKFSDVEAMMKKPHYGVTSIDELKIEKWSKHPQPYIDLGKQLLLRVYPKGLRCDSSNLHPQLSWNIGAQLVAMNIQTMDDPMRLNRGKFRINGQCGYILKPLCLRKQGVKREFNDNRILVVRVLCGVQLPKPNNAKGGEVIDPYVEVFINGFESDDTTGRIAATRVVSDNGFNPRWGEVFQFRLQACELATLGIRVMEKDTLSSDFIGDNYLPVTAIRSGLRCVPLYINGDKALPGPVGLLCHFSWKEVEPDSFVDIDENLKSATYRTISAMPGPEERRAMREARAAPPAAEPADDAFDYL
jgi:phosphatidylinositol phospholipase C delta